MSELATASAPEPLVPPHALAALIACIVGAAALADCALLAALIRRSRTGLFSIIIQLAVADIILLGSAIGPELWSLNSRNWIFGSRACAAYQGLNVFTSTLSTYLIAAIALHSLTTLRLEEKAIEKRTKRKDRDDDEEMRSSQNSLVANSDSSTPPRTMNVDYRVPNVAVPITLPTASVWILAASLSIPEFVLSTTINLRKNSTLCILDFSHQFNIQLLLTVFNLFLPLFIMSTTGALIIVKLISKPQQTPLETGDGCELVKSLKLSLWLMCVHLILCTPRAVVRAYRVYSAFDENESTLDVSAQDDTIAFIMLTLSGAYLLATLTRPLLCMTTLPRLRCFFSLHAKISDSV